MPWGGTGVDLARSLIPRPGVFVDAGDVRQVTQDLEDGCWLV